MFLEGERVRLRPHEDADAPVLQRWFSEPELGHLVGGFAQQYSLPAERALLEGAEPMGWERGVQLAIEATDIGEAPVLIGGTGIRRLDARSRSGEVGIAIAPPEYRGRGYGTDAMRTLCRFAFEELDLQRIALTTAEFNTRGVRSYEKVGFVVEGRLRRERYVAGRYYDTIVMGLLREEFEAREAERGARPLGVFP